MRTDGYAPIEDYAVIGDGRTAALVASDGSIDWLCVPNFDSASVFGALLDADRGGRFELRPAIPFTSTRRYLPSTNVLETTFVTDSGSLRVVDALTLPDGRLAPMRELVRSIEGLSGSVPMSWRFSPRFEYGAAEPRREWRGGVPVATSHAVALGVVSWDAGRPAWGEDGAAAEFELRAGSRAGLVLASAVAEPLVFPSREAVERRMADTVKFWRRWTADRQYSGPWADSVLRSALTLKLLVFAPSGASVAAPTTSLPEQIGGQRNWDYRYCWLRDATFTLLALMDAGYFDEAAAWRDWLLRAAAGSPSQVQIMYGLAGERVLPEAELEWLQGYDNSKPVRIGNDAYHQLQLDVYGEVMDALYQGRRGGLARSVESWSLQRALIKHLATVWQRPDQGLWEVRGAPQHFIYSKIMAWVAVDRTMRSAKEFHADHFVQQYRGLREQIHNEVCEKGYDRELGAFVQAYGSKLLDASALLIPVVGFLPADDPRVRSTVEQIEKRLLVDGLVLRYDSEKTDDGLPGGEGAFLACSFWLANNYVLLGRRADAREMFERLLSLRNDVGLLSEEYDPRTKRLVGNFPQAFSHVAVVGTAFNLSRTDTFDGRKPVSPQREHAEA